MASKRTNPSRRLTINSNTRRKLTTLNITTSTQLKTTEQQIWVPQALSSWCLSPSSVSLPLFLHYRSVLSPGPTFQPPITSHGNTSHHVDSPALDCNRANSLPLSSTSRRLPSSRLRRRFIDQYPPHLPRVYPWPSPCLLSRVYILP